MYNCNGFLFTTIFEAPLGKGCNSTKDNSDCNNVYAPVIGVILYLASNKKPDISFAVHKFALFNHNIKESRYTVVKRIFWYLQGTRGGFLAFNLSKIRVVGCYVGADFAGSGYLLILKIPFMLIVGLDLW